MYEVYIYYQNLGYVLPSLTFNDIINAYGEIKYLSDVNSLETRLTSLYTNTAQPLDWQSGITWINSTTFTANTANRWENNTKRLYDLGGLITNSIKYCGAFTCGFDGLYIGTNLILSPTSWSPTTSGSSTTINVTFNTSWAVSSDSSWLAFSPASGTGNGSITATVSTNSSTSRSGTLTVTGDGLTRTVTVTQAGTASVYICANGGDIYKQTNGTGNFVALGQTSRAWYGMTSANGNVYACVFNGDIYKQTNGTGNFVALGQTTRSWTAMTTINSDVYACVYNGDIYKQTNGTGNFVALGQTTRSWIGMTTANGNVYACVDGGDIYMQTGGMGNFNALSQTNRNYFGMTQRNGNVYVSENNATGQGIYMQTNGAGNFVTLNQTARAWRGMTTANGNVYAAVFSGDIYMQTAGIGNFTSFQSFTNIQWNHMTSL
jgi:DNA-directed RNA polymerase delta subunit